MNPDTHNSDILSIIPAKDVPESFFSSRRLSDRSHAAADILEAVRERGDAAVREYAGRFDRANPNTFLIPAREMEEAESALKERDPGLYDALRFSRDTAFRFAEKQRESFSDFETELVPGLVTGQRIIPVERAGVYVPAGNFPLLSSVIMGVIPARAAGVEEVILCSPPRPHPRQDAAGDVKDGGILPWIDGNILAAASLCGADRVYAVGGAQAIAAMAYGTELIPRADVIVGAGNRFVAEAKRLVYGEVGIDLIAGPTEVLIIADASANPEWVAADMLAQAEHDKDAQAILVTVSEAFAARAAAELEKQLAGMRNRETAAKSLADNGYIIIADSLDEAAAISDRKAPEHLELALADGPELDRIAARVRNYGSLFIGHGTAEVLGDYAAGLNHTLPTSGSARFTGGLSVRHFLKTVTALRKSAGVDDRGWRHSLESAEILGTAEGLEAHAAAARKRLEPER